MTVLEKGKAKLDAAQRGMSYRLPGYDKSDLQWWTAYIEGAEDQKREDAAAIEALQAEVESMDESCKKQLVAMASHVAELQAAQRKCESLFYGIDNIIVLLCIGDPSEDNIGLFCSDSTDSGGGENWWSAKFYRDKRPMIGIEDSREDREYFTSGWGQTWSVEQLKAYHSRNNLMAEKNKARQARFEHGEHGA